MERCELFSIFPSYCFSEKIILDSKVLHVYSYGEQYECQTKKDRMLTFHSGWTLKDHMQHGPLPYEVHMVMCTELLPVRP